MYLDQRGMQPSIPMKMVLGLVSEPSMAIMIAAANSGYRSEVDWKQALPTGIRTNDKAQFVHGKEDTTTFHAGRLKEGDKRDLWRARRMRSLIEISAEDYQRIEELQKSETIDGETVKLVEVELEIIPPGFKEHEELLFAGLKKNVVEFRRDGSKGRLIAHTKLVQKEVRGLLVAGGQPEFRGKIHELYQKSTNFRVSSWWLFWSYVLATLGELCLSPVGLSMVSKLAPAKFATMLMGVWMLTSAFGNFAAGAMGEVWGTIPPIDFFLLATAVLGGAARVCWCS